jgi:hypothetical protein
LQGGGRMDRNVNIATDLDGQKIVLINDIRFRAKKREDWKDVEEYSENTKMKHTSDAKYGWYLYDLLAIKKETSSPLES